MSFTSILAPIDSAHPCPEAFQAALRLARRFGSRLDILSYAPPPASAAPLYGATVGSAQVVGDALEALHAAAADALDKASAQAEQMGVAHDKRLASSPLVSMQEAVAQRGLVSDLIVSPRLEEGVKSRRMAIQGALFYAPAPLLVWPQDTPAEHADSLGTSVIVAWDGRKPASTAARMALPLLRAAQKVTVVSVTGEYSDTFVEHEPGADFIGWLTRSGVSAVLQTVEGSDVCGALRQVAADQNADMMVMGGYGHSQMLETIFGGVTETMLRDTTTPLFMAH